MHAKLFSLPNMSQFRARVLADLSQSMQPQITKRTGISKLLEGFAGHGDFIYRGTSGDSEINAIMETGFLAPTYAKNKKLDCLNLLAHVEDNDRKPYLSAAPCPKIALRYALFSMLPAMGYIIVMGRPRVFTRSQLLPFLDPAQVDRYITQKNNNSTGEEKYRSVKDTVANNNEVSIVLYPNSKLDWRPNVDGDVYQIIQFKNPGTILNTVRLPTDYTCSRIWTNPNFKQRVFSIEIVSAASEDLDPISKRAIDLGIIPRGHRVLLLEDAQSMHKSPELNDLEALPIAGTQKFMSVPQTIPIGDIGGLLGYMGDTLYNLSKAPSTDSYKSSLKA